MPRTFLTGALALGLMPLGLISVAAVPAMAAKPNIYHTISSTHGSAEVDLIEDCTRTEIFLSSSVAAYAAQPGPVNKQGLTAVFVRVSDVCAETPPGEIEAAAGGGSVLFSAEGQSMAPLLVDPRLRHASIDTELTGTDDQERPVSISLHATWTASGPLEHSTVHNPSHTEEGNVAANENNLRRPAVADVSVAVTGDGIDLSVSGTDQEAVLEQVKAMCIEVPRPGVTDFYPCFGFPG